MGSGHEDVALLVVDDDPDFLTVMQDLLCFRLGARVECAASAHDALRLIPDHDYDTVISDIRMPNMDGLMLTRRILELRPDLPTILVTAHGDRELGVQALNNGAYAYIQKPIDRDYLIVWVRRAIHTRRLTRQIDLQRRDLERQTERLEEANRALQTRILQQEQIECSLRESEERFDRLIAEVRDYAILLLDVDGNVISWNVGAELMKGYHAKEILGRHFSRFYRPEDVQAGRPGWLLRQAREAGRVEDEGWRMRKDRTLFWANVIITALHDPFGNVRGYVKITRDLTDRRRLEEEIYRSVRKQCEQGSRA